MFVFLQLMLLESVPLHSLWDHSVTASRAVSVTTRSQRSSGKSGPRNQPRGETWLKLSWFIITCCRSPFTRDSLPPIFCPHCHSSHFHAKNSKNEFKRNTKESKGYIYPSVIFLYADDRSPTECTTGEERKKQRFSEIETLFMFLEIPLEKPGRWTSKWIYEGLIIHGFQCSCYFLQEANSLKTSPFYLEK